MTTYIYTLSDPTTQKIRYVGKTVNVRKRLEQHKCLKASKGTHLASWITSLRANGLAPVLEVIAKTDGDDWVDIESRYIKQYKEMGCDLVNLTDGGEGAVGYKHTETGLAKMSAAWRYRKVNFIPSFRGKKHTPEAKLKIGIQNSGERNSQYGKPLPEIVRQKISKSMGRKVRILGVDYQSLRSAAKHLGILWPTFRYQYNKGYWPDEVKVNLI